MQSLAQALMNKVLCIVLSHFFQVLCLLVHARYISKYILTHSKVKKKLFFLSSFLFFIQWDTIISEGVFQFLHIFSKMVLRGTKNTLAVEVKIVFSRQKFQSLCSLFSSNFSKLNFDQQNVFTKIYSSFK